MIVILLVAIVALAWLSGYFLGKAAGRARRRELEDLIVAHHAVDADDWLVGDRCPVCAE